MLTVTFLKRAENDARVDRTAVVELRVRLDLFAVDIEKMLPRERLRRTRDSRVQLAMQIVERVAAKRGVGDFGSHGVLRTGLKPCATDDWWHSPLGLFNH